MLNIPFTDIPHMVESCLAALRDKQEEINALNVFPVPDGDTGTNLVMTVQAVLEELAGSSEQDHDAITKALTFGSLMGARGNAGVILSQMIRGVCEVLGSCQTIAAPDVVAALQRAADVAYQAVRKPVEGTMLTVLKDAALAANDLRPEDSDLVKFLENVLFEAERSLERTPDLLPVLKEAGVVDAGGYGLVVIGQGALAAIKGEEYQAASMVLTPSLSSDEEMSLEYRYCNEFLIRGSQLDAQSLQRELEQIGDSVMVVGSTDFMRVHVHSNKPAQVLAAALKMGSISQVRINNMEEQAEERSRKLAVTRKNIQVIAVASGQGVKQILTSLGVAKVVDGGQGMNPSTAEILEAINASPADAVLILPNNKNVVLTAQTAANESKKQASVVPTESVMEAFSALLAYDPEATVKANARAMEQARSRVKTGEITVAVRDSQSKAGAIRTNDYIGLSDHEVKVVGRSLPDTALKLVNQMLSADDETVTLLCGSDVSPKVGEKIMQKIVRKHPDLEVELHAGGQPLYHLLIGIE